MLPLQLSMLLPFCPTPIHPQVLFVILIIQRASFLKVISLSGSQASLCFFVSFIASGHPGLKPQLLHSLASLTSLCLEISSTLKLNKEGNLPHKWSFNFLVLQEQIISFPIDRHGWEAIQSKPMPGREAWHSQGPVPESGSVVFRDLAADASTE